MATQAEMNINNPFDGYGAIVSGRHFVGRREELLQLNMRVMPKEGFGNLAVVGLPRIGKSSLVWEGIMSRQNELLADKTIAVWFTASTMRNAAAIHKGLSKRVIEVLEKAGDSGVLDRILPLNEKLQQCSDMQEVEDGLREVLRCLKKCDWKVILILDEFDSVKKYMDFFDFQFLRDISYIPEYKICLVTTSRMTIKSIESKDGAVSNLHGTFQTLQLKCFDQPSIDDYWQWSETCWRDSKVQLPVPWKIYKQEAAFQVNRHPFLLNIFNSYRFNEQVLKRNLSAEREIDLFNQFSSMEGSLQKEKMENPVGISSTLLDAAVQLVLGPVYNVTKTDEKKLLLFDFLRVVPKEEKDELLGFSMGPVLPDGSCYACFSNYLTQLFSELHTYDITYWAEWRETEKALRELIKVYVQQRFGDNWETEIVAAYGGRSQRWREEFNKMKSYRDNMVRKSKKASSNLVDYTQASSVFTIFIDSDWNWFHEVLKGKNPYARKDSWESKFNFLAYVRNPQAHNNEEFLTQEEVNTATGYCNEILEAIAYWRKNLSL